MSKMSLNRKHLMADWDFWRKRIANGDRGSGPRDWFESVLDSCEERASRQNPSVCEVCLGNADTTQPKCNGKFGSDNCNDWLLGWFAGEE